MPTQKKKLKDTHEVGQKDEPLTYCKDLVKEQP